MRTRKNQQKYGFEVTPIYFFIVKNIVITAAVMGLCYLMASYKGLPNVLVLLFVLITVYAFITSQTVIGRRIYAMGGNEKAARLSGVNTPRLLFYTFVNMGVLAALAGLIVAARLNSATPNAGDWYGIGCDCCLFHRWRIGQRWYRYSHRRSGWRFSHRRLEQWHVHYGSRDRLAEGCQRSGAAGGRVIRCV